MVAACFMRLQGRPCAWMWRAHLPHRVFHILHDLAAPPKLITVSPDTQHSSSQSRRP